MELNGGVQPFLPLDPDEFPRLGERWSERFDDEAVDALEEELAGVGEVEVVRDADDGAPEPLPPAERGDILRYSVADLLIDDPEGGTEGPVDASRRFIHRHPVLRRPGDDRHLLDGQGTGGLGDRAEDRAVAGFPTARDVHAGAHHENPHRFSPKRHSATTRSFGESMSITSPGSMTYGRIRSPVIEFLPKIVEGRVTSTTQL